MFLRGQSISRLQSATLRLWGSSAPSTCYFSSGSLVQSQYSSNAIVTSTPQLARHFGVSLVWYRGGGRKKCEEVKGAETKQTNGSSSNNGGEDLVGKRAKLLVVLNVIILSSFVIHWAFKRHLKSLAESAIPADAQQVDFDTFVQKYLKAGEIQKISLVLFNRKAVGTLHEGATIDGIPAVSGHIVVDYIDQSKPFRSGFRKDVRKVETELGIALPQGVRIEDFGPLSGWKFLFDLCQTITMACFVCFSFSKLGRQATDRMCKAAAMAIVRKLGLKKGAN